MRAGASTRVAAVVGRPITHSLSPLLHNAWLEAAQIDGIYIGLSPEMGRFKTLVDSMRGGAVAGFNVTVPFKVEALEVADVADDAARQAGAANLLLFHPDGTCEARNTDGIGLMAAFAEQAPMFHVERGPVVILGAGGAARGAAAALRAVGCPQIRFVNRTVPNAESLASTFGGRAYSIPNAASAFEGASAIINSMSVGLGSEPQTPWPLDAAPPETVVMDMTYRPLITPILATARARGLVTVDGLEMLIGQARPSFEALFGALPPAIVDARAILLDAVGTPE